ASGPKWARAAAAEVPQAAPAVELEAPYRRHRARAPRARRRVGDRRVPVLPQWGQEGERAAGSLRARRADETERAAAVESFDAAFARPRSREHRSAGRPEPQRLDHDPAQGSRPA